MQIPFRLLFPKMSGTGSAPGGYTQQPKLNVPPASARRGTQPSEEQIFYQWFVWGMLLICALSAAITALMLQDQI